MPPEQLPTIAAAAARLAAGKVTARELVEQALARATDPQGEGARVFLKLHGERARHAADHADFLRARGHAPGPYAGVPVSVKDLFDEAGEVTRAGSVLFGANPPAAADCPAVARLRAAGFIVMGRTNMTEFAYSGLGLNPHYDTPRNPYDRETGRIPGGSSAGGVISVTDGMAFAGLGSDTGGSCRIPAALSGAVGYKPTQRRGVLEGVVPLSPTLDTIGCLARSVACCAAVMGVVHGEAEQPFSPPPAFRPRLGVPKTLVFDGAEDEVLSAFDAARKTLSDKGCAIVDLPLEAFADTPRLAVHGGFPSAESFTYFRKWLDDTPEKFDPRVCSRMERGRGQSAADYISLHETRRACIAAFGRAVADVDAIIFPVTPLVAPPIAAFADDATYDRVNLAMLRNSTLINYADGCALSLPIHEPGAAPVGLMVAGARGQDRHVLRVAAALEAMLAVA